MTRGSRANYSQTGKGEGRVNRKLIKHNKAQQLVLMGSIGSGGWFGYMPTYILSQTGYYLNFGGNRAIGACWGGGGWQNAIISFKE